LLEIPSGWPRFDLAFLSASSEVSRRAASALAAAGAVVIDLSAAHRDAKDASLALPGHSAPPQTSIVALPDPLTTLLVLVLQPIAARVKLRRAVATGLMSISAQGREALDHLGAESAELLNGRAPEDDRNLAFDCAPEEGDGERFLGAEVRRDVSRLLGVDLPLSFAAVRVPLFFGQGLSLAVEADEPLDANEVQRWLREAPSLVVDPAGSAMTIRGAAGGEAVHVALVRTDPADPRWLSLWATSDNVRQGGALAAVSLAESIIRFRGAH
ncbi:MAG: Asd/ArgC dimerization domain-containing protein, partial [Candidatus Binatia bacterium]